MKRISYLGLGTMGAGMANTLLKSGYELTVWNRSRKKCEAFAKKGARVAKTPADAVQDAEFIFYSLSDDKAVEKVVFGRKGILSAIKAGQIAIDMSTVLPTTTRREAKAFRKKKVGFLDAPVFGSKKEAAEAGLWMLAAGDKKTFEKARPILRKLGETLHYFGAENGNATSMKLVGNLIVALELEALAEGLVLARKAGINLKTLMEVLKVADFRAPLLVANGENILQRDFSTSFALKLMLKDAKLIAKFARKLKSPTPAIAIVEKNLRAAMRLGAGEENASALIKALEKKAKVKAKN